VANGLRTQTVRRDPKRSQAGGLPAREAKQGPTLGPWGVARIVVRAPVRGDLRQDAAGVVMSQGVHRIVVVCVALVACEPPTPTPAPPAVAAVVTPVATPVEKPAPTPEPEEPAQPQVRPQPLAPEVEQAVGRSINALTIDLQRALAKQPGNVLVSGMSVSVGLAMVHAGSGGKTAKELAEVLHFEGAAGELHAGFAGLAARWNQPDDHVTLIAASRLFGEEKMVFDPAYVELTRTIFGAPLLALDILNDPAGTRGQINAWVREQTRDEISEVVPEGSILPTARLVLADAMYFKADWSEPFEVATTAPATFYAPGGNREVAMMRAVQRLRVAFGKAGKLRVLELPYAGGEYSMVIVLPAKRDGLEEIEKQFDAAKLQGWLDAARPTAIDLRLPRFRVDSGLDLTPALRKLGANKIFDSRRAELSGMAKEKLGLAGVHHRAQITVEEGEPAAPATAIVVSVGSAPSNPVPFVVDRPFLFYVRDVRTGTLLLYGRVMDPT